MGLSRTAEVFEAEWYELKATGRLEAAGSSVVPDIYLRNGVSTSSAHAQAVHQHILKLPCLPCTQ